MPLTYVRTACSAVAAGAHVLYYQLKYPAMYIVGSRVYPAGG